VSAAKRRATHAAGNGEGRSRSYFAALAAYLPLDAPPGKINPSEQCGAIQRVILKGDTGTEEPLDSVTGRADEGLIEDAAFVQATCLAWRSADE
jgi:hypothetical protein